MSEAGDEVETARCHFCSKEGNAHHDWCIVLGAGASLHTPPVDAETIKALALECAADLEAELMDRYGAHDKGGIHPAMRPKFDRDMEPVRRLRAALSDAPQEDAL